MELQSGARLFAQQYKALLLKNAILTWRHKRSAILQLFSSLFFIFLIFCIDKSVKSRFSFTTAYDNVFDPKEVVSPPIPSCEEKVYIRKPCFDFVWSGNGSARIRGIVSAIMRNNPGREIPSEKVKSFTTPDAVDVWLLSNPLRCPGALHLVEKNSTVISYGLQTNSTSVAKRGNYEDPTFKFQIPLQVAAEREIARFLLEDPNFDWVVRFKEFAHPATETFSTVGQAGPTFFLAIAMFGFVFQISSLVTEKELKLRQAMSIMGLYESAFWLSWLTWEALLTFLAALFTVLFGMLFQFNFFLHNSFAVLFLVFFLFQLNMLSFAFMISTFISKSSSATTVGFSIFIIGFLTQLVTTFGFPYARTYTKFYRTIWSLFPPNLLAKALDILGTATATPEDPGISWQSREGGLCTCMGSLSPPDYVIPDDEDVLAEETIVKQQAAEDNRDSSVAVQIHGLTKTYPGTTKIGCCKCTKTPPYHAVKGIWVNLAKDQLFCLLVRSSVGMSNIRRIIGVCPQFDVLWDALTSKEHLNLFASIKGLHPSLIKSVTEQSLAEVKLTNTAHVRAGSYSGGMKRRLSVAIALIGDPKMVFLDEPVNSCVQLCVQTTGMDPITRRHVWDIIENAKKRRAIVLTTHSMEEADILGDRIAIMAKGRLRCIGTSIRLKSRFGTGYIANVSFLGSNPGQTATDAEQDASWEEPKALLVKQFFKNRLDVDPKEENKSFLTFVIPRDKESLLTEFFTELQDRENELGITDIQLGLTTLEEVFLNIAKQAELESASAEATMVTLSLSSGTSIQIPKGSRFVGIPGTETADNPRGVMVEVYWEQDESGDLCISGHSLETPIPSNVYIPSDHSAPASLRNSRHQSGTIVGFAIDPKQITSR
ncbi:ABC transporter A family member 2 [Apostasia shenzhenica]|uniref:ABC transporter A family member 2 n=1 Tax=Apostasia shenzhenica TaxID=1088818 RepID=A0A2H9ZWH2_9ASPA|nr:ABC transporter A family member 2 [Apostasia shenzhenica]